MGQLWRRARHLARVPIGRTSNARNSVTVRPIKKLPETKHDEFCVVNMIRHSEQNSVLKKTQSHPNFCSCRPLQLKKYSQNKKKNPHIYIYILLPRVFVFFFQLYCTAVVCHKCHRSSRCGPVVRVPVGSMYIIVAPRFTPTPWSRHSLRLSAARYNVPQLSAALFDQRTHNPE